MEPKVYKLLDDDEILRKIEDSGNNIEIQNIQECVEIVNKNMKDKEHFEKAGEDFKKLSPSRSLEKIENENSNFNEKHDDHIEKLSPCSSPLEKRKKFENEHEHNLKKLSPCSSPLEKSKNLERIVTSPDLFCDSDDDVEMVCNKE
uniref:Uncharacterized protein n=1 Tax=Megaselia scalaris TaxID=36166 RepID=T1GQN6_MEGSC